MSKPLVCLISLLIGGYAGAIITALQDSNVPSSRIGHGYKEVLQMKKDCELNLPRSQDCVPELKFVPNNSDDSK